MRVGKFYHRIDFYSKVSTRDIYGASSNTWPIKTIETRGEINWKGGGKSLSNEEITYGKSMELIVRYRADIVETMRVQIDDKSDLYDIVYIEEIGRYDGLRLTLEKCPDGLAETPTEVPTAFSATKLSDTEIDLAWTCNAADDATSIERSTDGNSWTVIDTTDAAATTYADTELTAETQYFYRIRHFLYYNYSAYTTINYATTDA